jgi:hypothetical protein
MRNGVEQTQVQSDLFRPMQLGPYQRLWCKFFAVDNMGLMTAKGC